MIVAVNTVASNNRQHTSIPVIPIKEHYVLLYVQFFYYLHVRKFHIHKTITYINQSRWISGILMIKMNECVFALF